MQQVQVSVFDHSGFSEVHSFPTGMGLSLMEALKAAGYPIEAICGGLALCASCRLDWLEGSVSEPNDAELDMLDTLPDNQSCSRLACQIRLESLYDGRASIRLNPSKS
ncbi:MAG: (2Fe-2S)-binding protein [Sphingomonadales bacterium]|nr:(2Fe-2S)-binding protein [Sphingomonadales bacterium]